MVKDSDKYGNVKDKASRGGERVYTDKNIYSSLPAAVNVNRTAHTAYQAFPTKWEKKGKCGLEEV